MKSEYTRTETEKFDTLLDQKYIFDTSEILDISDYTKWIYLYRYLNECMENIVCKPDPNDVATILFSAHEDQIYLDATFDFVYTRYEYQIYMSINDEGKLQVIAHMSTIKEEGLTEYQYIDYLEDDQELAISYNKYGAKYYLHNIKNKERIEWNDYYTDGKYQIPYYDPTFDIKFEGTYADNIVSNYSITQYKNGHPMIRIYNDNRYSIGLNHVNGWNLIKRVPYEVDSVSDYHLYQNESLIHDDLIVYISMRTGDIHLFLTEKIFRVSI